MAGLYTTKQSFFHMAPDARAAFIRSYRIRRASDMEKPATYGVTAKKKATIAEQFMQLGLSPEEIKTAKALGLNPKVILELRSQNA